MTKLLTLTVLALLAISCDVSRSSKGSSMAYSVATQAELDAGNQRINQFKQELLRQGFHEVSVSFSDKTFSTSLVNSKEEVVLEGQYGKLRDLRVTLWTTKLLEKEQSQLGGGIQASLSDEQADRDFDELYKKVSFVVTGQSQ